MAQREDGGPAFPHSFEWTKHPNWSESDGLSIRDYFAAQALIALMSCDRWVFHADRAFEREGHTFKAGMAAHAYELADAMLKARDAAGPDPAERG